MYEGAFKQESNQKVNVRTSSLKELFKDKEFVLSYKKIPKKTTSSSEFSRSTFEENNGFTIVGETVRVVETDSVTTYTLLIESDDNTEGNLENLVLYSELQDGELGYVIEYHSLSDLGLTEEEIIENGIKDVDGILTDDNTAGKVVFVHYWIQHCIVLNTHPLFCGGVERSENFTNQCGHWESRYVFVDEEGGGSGGSGGGTGGTVEDGVGGSGGGITTSPVTLTPKQLLNKAYKKHVALTANKVCFDNLTDDDEEALLNFLELEVTDDGIITSTNNFETADDILNTFCSSQNNLTSIKPLIVEKQIKDNNLDPCAKSLLNKLKNLSQSDISFILNKLGVNSTYTLNIITDYPSDPNALASTNWNTNTSGSIIPYNYNIKIRPDYTSIGTDLAIAGTMLHEIIHAYFLSLIDDCNQTSNCTLLQNFPDLWNFYVANQNNGVYTNGISQHNQIALSYVNALGSSLQEFITGIPLSANQTPEQVYTDIAWYGLEGTIPYNALPQADKDRAKFRFENVELLNQSAVNLAGQTIVPKGTRTSPCN